jgi:hypothetical protein
MLNAILLSVVAPSVIVSQFQTMIECYYRVKHFIFCYAECHYAECHYAEYHYAECRYAECHFAECHGASFYMNECNYTECCFIY